MDQRSARLTASTATMPNYHLSDDDARDISAFIIAQSTPLEPPLQPLKAEAKAAADPAAGTSLYGAILLRVVSRHAERGRNDGRR